MFDCDYKAKGEELFGWMRSKVSEFGKRKET
jgi:hypothetical protein